jgi:beta-N-acetylhexosaminidase
MTELERLAHAVVVAGFVGTSPPDWVRRRLDAGLGGVVLFARNCVSDDQLWTLTGALRRDRPDLLVAVDEEGGDVTRLDAATGSPYPGHLALGVADDVAATAAVAAGIGRRLASVGVDWNLAPVADVNANPDNPVIGVRSFGSSPALVARHVAAFVGGTQSAGVAACAKHFPGHGDTAVDSHRGLPTVGDDLAALRSGALLPFAAAVDAGTRSVMTGHLLVPALDPRLPATLSPALVTGLLRGELGFDGVVMADALEMAGVAATVGVADGAGLAVAAGCDALCMGGDEVGEELVATAVGGVLAAVRDGRLAEERLAEAASRVAALAAWTRAARDGVVARALDGVPPAEAMAVARAAVQVADAGRSWGSGVPVVVELDPARNIAVGAATTWGLGAPVAAVRPGTTVVRLSASDDALATVLAAAPDAASRPVVVAVRDAHRYAWERAAVRTLRAALPAAVVVEMGLPGAPADLVTHGASRVSAQAAAERLMGGAG